MSIEIGLVVMYVIGFVFGFSVYHVVRFGVKEWRYIMSEKIVITDSMVHEVKNIAGNIISVDAIKEALRKGNGDVNEAIRILGVSELEFVKPSK